MADLQESPDFTEGVYQIETTDPVVGGAPDPASGEGTANIPHLQLAKRTRWLKDQVASLGQQLAALTPQGLLGKVNHYRLTPVASAPCVERY